MNLQNNWAWNPIPQNNNNMSGWAAAGAAAAGIASPIISGLGIGTRKRMKRELRYNMALADHNQRIAEQMGLFNYDLSKKYWDETNYGAQVEHMQKAGLNPGLMYGQGGQGGQTIGSMSPSPNPGQNPNIPHIQGIGLSKSVDAALALAQKENIEADTANKKAQTDKTTGVDTEEVKANISLLQQEVKNKKDQQRLTQLQSDYQGIINDIEGATMGWQIQKAFYELGKEIEETEEIGLRNKVSREVLESDIQKRRGEAMQVSLQNTLLRAQTNLTNEQANAISEKVAQDWQTVSQGWIGLSLKQREIAINKFQAEVKAEFPGLSQITGKALSDFYDLIGSLPMGVVPGRDPNSRTRKVQD